MMRSIKNLTKKVFFFSGEVEKKKKTKKMLTFLLALFLFLASVRPLMVSAQKFDPNYIITDDELFNPNSLSQTAIQTFLERKNSVLARYGQGVNGKNIMASQIIWEIGQKHNISPKYLLTTLEKEQGLIRKSHATEKELDWATGYGCFNGGCNEKHRGFYNQVEAAAETQEIYRNKASTFKFIVNKATKTFDGFNVIPQNQATANLYIYTPHIGNAPELGIRSRFGGVKLFWLIWTRYFTNQKYVSGMTVTDGQNFWLIRDEKKYPFISQDVYLTYYKESDAIKAKASSLSAYPDGPTIYFANNTLVRSNVTKQAYLLLDGQKMLIVDDVALGQLNNYRLAAVNSLNDIPDIEHSKLEAYPDGFIITAQTKYPQGKLFQDESGKIFLIKSGQKFSVSDEVWKINYEGQTPERTSESELHQYLTIGAIAVKNATFLKNTNDSYYVISNQKKIKVEKDALIQTFGREKFDSAVLVSDETLQAHEDGINIDYIDDSLIDLPPSPVPQPIYTAYTYKSEFKDMSPSSVILLPKQLTEVTASFQNIGNAEWKKDMIWLELEGMQEKFTMNEDAVTPNQLATFKVVFTAQEQAGIQQVRFHLYRNNNGNAEKITTGGKFILIKPGTSAEVIDNSIPLAVKNSWKPIPITLKIKNTSQETIWLSKKSALKIYDEREGQSPFYDPNDWVKTDVAAVPVNKKQIKPGETGEFKFTLKLKGVEPGRHILKFKLELLDKDNDKKDVFLNGKPTWDRVIRVDK